MQFLMSLATTPKQKAVFFMLISTAAFSAMNVYVRMASATLEPTLIVTLRNLLTLALLVPLVMPKRFAVLRTKRLKAHFWRSVIGAIGMITWTYCLTFIPLAHATALSFTAPLLATLFAILFLKEHAHARQWVALSAGFIGTLVILRPGVGVFDWSSLLVILAASAWAITSMFIKSLSNTEPALRMVFYMNLMMFFIALPFGLGHWQTPTLHDWGLIAGISVCSILMHFTLARAYALVPVVTLMPFDFMRLVYTSALAYLIFGEIIDPLTWAGAAIIIGSVIYGSGRDAKVTAVE